MNTWAAVCGSLFIRSLSALCPVIQPFQFPCSKLSFCWFCSCAANCDCVCCCPSTHVQISNQCFASALCCVLSWMFVSSSTLSIWLVCLPFQWLWCQHWLAFALTNHAPSKPIALTLTPHNHDWLLRWRLPAVLRFHFLLAPIAAPYLAPCACPCAVYGWLCFGERCSSPKYGLIADRYHFCEKCFNEIQGETVSLGDDPTQPQTWVPVYFFFI